MDGPFWNDLMEPFIAANLTQVTLASTAKALYTPSNFPYLGPSFFKRVGKKIRIRLYGGMTTGATPGNGSFNAYYGSGADANGVVLLTGTPVALSANASNLSWWAELFIRCNSVGSAGTLLCTGHAGFNNSLIASSLQPILLPTGAPAASGACDLTAANIISVQFLRSGSTAETMQVGDMEVTSLN